MLKRRMIAVIPAKGNSSRVPNKNFREFYNGKSLLEIKIEQCVNAGVFDEIYVSSDSQKAEKIVEKYDVNFVLRDVKFCLDETPWSEVLEGVLDQLPESGDTLIAWAPLTAPLFKGYEKALEILNSNLEYDSLMSVTKLQHYFLNSDKIPYNFQYGIWASYSQNIKPIYQMNCALWLATKKSMLQNRFQIGDRPYYMETSMIEGIDIDTMEEFEIASLLFEREINKVIG